jgi:hypothetical protein
VFPPQTAAALHDAGSQLVAINASLAAAVALAKPYAAHDAPSRKLCRMNNPLNGRQPTKFVPAKVPQFWQINLVRKKDRAPETCKGARHASLERLVTL